MIQIKLLKAYQENNAGDIIAVSNNIAFGLIEQGIARSTTNEDFMKKTALGSTKAFANAPSRRKIEVADSADTVDEDE